MKYILFLLLLLTSATYSQEIEDKVFEFSELDEKPDFKGGIMQFYQYVGKNFKVPEEESLNGKIILSFIIEKDGSITNIKVIQDLGFGTAEEGIRVLSTSPKWLPAKKDGVPVRTYFQLPIAIRHN